MLPQGQRDVTQELGAGFGDEELVFEADAGVELGGVAAGFDAKDHAGQELDEGVGERPTLVSDLTFESFIEPLMGTYGKDDTDACILMKHIGNAKRAAPLQIDFERTKPHKAS